MASTKEYLDFVLEQLSGLDEISSRAMMGEFILYYRGKVFGGRKPVFKRTRTAIERNNIFATIKRYAKKLKPQYNGRNS